MLIFIAGRYTPRASIYTTKITYQNTGLQQESDTWLMFAGFSLFDFPLTQAAIYALYPAGLPDKATHDMHKNSNCQVIQNSL